MPKESSANAQILLARLNALGANAPSFSNYSPSSRTHMEWVGRLQAVLKRADPSQDSELRSAITSLIGGLPSTQAESWGKIHLIFSRAIEELELRISEAGESGDRDQAFGPGAAYDFFKALSAVIASASKTILIVDPYMDSTIFDRYLGSVKSGVSVRLLVMKYAQNVKIAKDLFEKQHALTIDARRSDIIHDRLVFLDGLECWALGQSIKDAADKKPTYLAPLSADVSQLKLTHYDDIWTNHASSI